MIYIKILTAVILIVLSISSFKIKKTFKPIFIIYICVSVFVMWSSLCEVFIIFYSGADIELQQADGTVQKMVLSEHIFIILSALVILYLLPVLFFCKAVPKSNILIVLLLTSSILPDVFRSSVWHLILTKPVKKQASYKRLFEIWGQ